MQNADIQHYHSYSLKLAAKPRQGGGNMFRHQMEALAILLEYGYTEPVLLKAALIHDLVEDGGKVGFLAFEEIESLDEDRSEILTLVKEVSRKVIVGVKEPKIEFLLQSIDHDSNLVKFLKLADLNSNLSTHYTYRE
jgi:GTP pyrophosphokinase